MQCYTELTPPTTVTHSLSLPFLSATANNLIVIKTSLLQVFALKSIITTTDDVQLPQAVNGFTKGEGKGLATNRTERIQTTKLVLLAEYELAGTVTSIARVKPLQSRSGGDALLVALRDAKLSLVEWDPERYSISTISIHYYESEDILSSPWEPDLAQSGTILSVDPGSRCAVFKFGARHIAILPFHQAGDDMALGDEDELDGAKLERKTSSTKQREGDDANKKTPYSASFVLSLLALDPTLKHPIHLSFLNEYREPTFGILSSQIATSTSLLGDRKDAVSYAVYNLDLEQRASTSLLSVNNLPYDLFEVVPLSRIVGGALLVGGNELIHVDQSGKTNGVAVNEAAKQGTSFALADQSSMDLRLEQCMIKQLGADNPELLIVEDNGALLVLSFKIDGRSVSGLHLRRVQQDGSPLLAGASCATTVGRGRIFVGSEDADSLILGWSRPSDRVRRKSSRMDLATEDDEDLPELDDIEVEDDEDDLYADDKPNDVANPANASGTPAPEEDYKFRVHDSLLNVGPLTDITLGQKSSSSAHESGPQSQEELLAISGQGKAGSLISFRRTLDMDVIRKFDIDGVRSIWSLSAKGTQALATASSDTFDNYLITAVNDSNGEDKTRVYSFGDDGLDQVQNADFDSDAGAAVECGTMNSGSRIVQVLPSEVRTYDADLGLAQIFPLSDEETESEVKVQSASFADPYLLLIKDDQSLTILVADESGDLDEVPQGEATTQRKWASGSLYEDASDVLRLDYADDEEESSNVLAFLLTVNGGLHIYRLPGLQKPVYVADGLSLLPPFLHPDFTIRRSVARETIAGIVMADLGDAVSKVPYLFLRTLEDDVIIYQPYQAQVEGSKDTMLRFLKLPVSHFAPSSDVDVMDEDTPKPRSSLRYINDLNGYSAISISGPIPGFILKSASCQPRRINLSRTNITSIVPLNLPSCSKGFAFIDDQATITSALLPAQTNYSTGWPTQRIPLHATINALAYHTPQNAYILSTSHPIPFKLPTDDSHRTIPPLDEPFLPTIDQSTLHLFDRPTATTISTHTLDPHEIVLCITTAQLETSEITHSRADLVCVGTGIVRGEDTAMTGHIYVFSIINVVPDPDHPETGRALKLVAKEETKGAVTSLSGVGTQGFLMASQGQKTLVRGLKEDGSLLPVAFMDMQVFPTVVRELGGTGLCVMGDEGGRVWFAGYTEDPYQIRLFSKSPYPIETITASFLPDGRNLYIIALDADGNIHVFQYDPEHPSSLSGTHLLPLHLPAFHTPHYPSTLTLLPSTPPTSSTTTTTTTTTPFGLPPNSLLLTTTPGSLALITPLPPSSHRTLSALQNHLISSLPHALGLNPRALRASGEQGDPRDRRMGGVGGGGGGRMGGIGGGGSCVLDGMVLRRWMELGTWRRWGGEDRRVLRGLVREAVGWV